MGEKGLFEFMKDLETWNLVNNVVRPKVVEIWAILGGTGDDADVAEDANIDSDIVDPLLNVGDNIIANSLTNAQNMAVDTSQMEIIPSSQLQFEKMDNTSHQQQEQKSTKRKHKSKQTKSLGLTKSRTTVAKTYRTTSSNIMKFKNDKSSAIELD
nr:uncharacterized protein LOC109156638 [Ipomoea trifida]GLL27402.1 uncharacterized protein LOC109156638 [Ipomoea trifida]GLL33676.1 uncharacterized protein LOC109156638 [Ipomoea trifida]GLL33710.1 uncharacterized protein LOC109156638 [Ipomoea trifida]